LAEEVAKRGEVLERWIVGMGSYLHLFLVFVHLFIITSRRFKLRGSMLPRFLVAARAALQTRLLCLRAHNHSLWTRLASHLITPLGKVTHAGRYVRT
jgi:hypothetical protein